MAGAPKPRSVKAKSADAAVAGGGSWGCGIILPALISLVAVGVALSPLPRPVAWEADAPAVGLADGRRLAYHESGARNGLTTLLFIHG